ncbi:glycosyltransferase family 2 protein [Pedobacter aquae]|uniref:Glycosyltransferase family 2 protein n=1 Tax=Pedobacter aquae TaxID=2605747 RepID=A0A5C0VFF5_9SPHI|nr:glycosyltransferase family 2 protein [Pedobacter aquae]QEK50331.1 glycosyltransferase family 2 protein [Pedobacter aquae]
MLNTNAHPLISVIVPNYNHAQYLKQRLDSVLNQTFQDFELIILDDCSTDKSKAAIETYRGHEKISHIIYNEQNSGSPFKQWEKGISLAKGEYIWIAESDDYCESNFLKIGLKSILDKKADIFISKTIRVDEKNNYIDSLDFWYKDLNSSKWKSNYINNNLDEIKSFLIYKNTIPNASGVIFKKIEAIKDCLSAIQNFKFCGDWLFWLMYLKKTNKVIFNSEIKNYFRTHNNTTRSKFQYTRNIEVLRIYKWVTTEILGKENKKLLSYYFDNYIRHYPRLHIFKNLNFVVKSLNFTYYGPYFILKNYLKTK